MMDLLTAREKDANPLDLPASSVNVMLIINLSWTCLDARAPSPSH